MPDTSYIYFPNINIPPSSFITSAFILFKSYLDLESIDVNVTCYFADEDNPSVPTSKSDVDNYPRTSGVEWTNIDLWQDNYVYRTPNLKDILQEVVNREGWLSGNSVLFLAENNGSGSDSNRLFSSLEYRNGSEKANLIVDWIEPSTLKSPDISPNSGHYYDKQLVTLSSYPSDADIRYTLDDSDPTESSPLYVSPFYIGDSCTLKAKSFKSYWTPSGISSRIYNFRESLTYTVSNKGRAQYRIDNTRPSGYSFIPLTWVSGSIQAWIARYWSILSEVYYLTFQSVVLKFDNIQVNQGEQISYSQIDLFSTVGSNWNNVITHWPDSIYLYSVQQANPSMPTTIAQYLTLRSSFGSGILTGIRYFSSGSQHSYLNITSDIQSIINLPGWTKGNSIILCIECIPYPVDNPRTGYQQYILQEWRDSPKSFEVWQEFYENTELQIDFDVNSITTTTTTSSSTTTTTTV